MPLVDSHLEPVSTNRASEAGGRKFQKDISAIGMLAFAFKVRGLFVVELRYLFISLALVYLYLTIC